VDAPSLELIGTATTILRMGPFALLTDPNFLHRGQRAYLGKGLSSRRLTEPSRQPDGLPDLDAVVLSHLHGDHFDRVARRELDHALPVLTTESAVRPLRRWGFEAAQPMKPWDDTTMTRDDWSLRVTSVPGVHAPGPARFLLPPVMGTVLELSRGAGPVHRTYITGDTLCRPWLAEVTRRMGPLNALVAHLGGTRLLGLLVTMDGVQGADLVELLEPRLTVPIHNDDYGVFRSPVSAFVDECSARGLGRVTVVARGEEVSLAPGATI
jgi:L-ascorbate metabolism protein UlaG (beta-lactamase superfamily)